MSVSINNSFSGSNGDNVLVDKMLGSNYDLVRKVALNIDTLKSIKDDPNISDLTENYKEVKKALDASSQLLEVSNNLTDILNSKAQASIAKTSAEQSVNSLNQVREVAKQTQKDVETVNQIATDLNEVAKDLEIVSDNIDSIKNVSSAVTDIRNINRVLENADTVNAIKEVSNNIEPINKVNDNLDSLVDLANTVIDNGVADKLEQQLNDIKNNLILYQEVLVSIRGEVSNFEQKVKEFDIEVSHQISNIQLEATRQIKEILKVSDKIEKYLKSLEKTKAELDKIQEDCNRLLIDIKEIYFSAEEAISDALQDAIAQLISRADEQYTRIRLEGDVQVNRLHNTLDNVVEDAIDSLKELAQDVKDDIIQDIQQEANNSYDSLKAELEKTASDAINKIEETAAKVNLNINELTTKVNAISTAVDDLKVKVNESIKGNIRYALKDYSLVQNQGEMLVGTAYRTFLDENGNYIALNPDTNAPLDPSKVIKTIREYTKSSSGSVTFRDTNLDGSKQNIEFATLEEAVAALVSNKAMSPVRTKDAFDAFFKKQLEDLNGNKFVTKIVEIISNDEDLKESLLDNIKKANYDTSGIVELATTEEVKSGISNAVVVTPLNLKESLRDLLIKAFQREHPDLTNNVVQQIVDTICDDVHLLEPLASALTTQQADTQYATTDRAGVVKLATIDEALAGLDSTKALTPVCINGFTNKLDTIEDNLDKVTQEFNELKKTASSYKVVYDVPPIIEDNKVYVIID